MKAFPHDWKEAPNEALGMDLRDYFAAKAMQAILSNPAMIDKADTQSIEWVVDTAQQVADQMMEARND